VRRPETLPNRFESSLSGPVNENKLPARRKRGLDAVGLRGLCPGDALEQLEHVGTISGRLPKKIRPHAP
jgi:hypothetical protein